MNMGKQNDSPACWHRLYPRYWASQQEKYCSYPPDCMGRVTEFPNCVGCTPFEDPLMGGHTVSKSPSYSIFKEKED